MAEAKNVTAGEIMELIKRQAYLCALSGRSLTPETASVDHIEPLGRGGKHEIGNLWVVDHQVNTAKGMLSLDEFISLCREVARHQDGLDAMAAGEDF